MLCKCQFLFRITVCNVTPELGVSVEYLGWRIDVFVVCEDQIGYLNLFRRLQSHCQSILVVSDFNSQREKDGSHTMRRDGRARP